MKIKNLKCYLLGAIILTNSSLAMSCAVIEEGYDKIKNKDFYDFLEDNDIIAISDLSDITRNYYEVEVSEHKEVGDRLISVGTHYERLDCIDNVICMATEYDYDYKVLKITGSDGNYEVKSKIIEDIDLREDGYDYVYKDDYVIEDGCRDVYIKYGKVLKRE